MAANERTVNLHVRAQDGYSKVFKNLEGEAKRLAIALQAQQRRQQIGVAKQAIDDQINNFKRLHSEIGRYNDILAQAGRSSRLSASEIAEVREQITLLRARANDAVGAINRQKVAMDGLTGSTKTGFAALAKKEAAMRKADDAARQSAAAARDRAAAEAQAAAAVAKSERQAETRAAVQQRLNDRVKTGFGNWSRYVDTLNRVRTAEEASIRTAQRKLEIQQRLDNPVASGFKAWSQSVNGAASGAPTRAVPDAVVPVLNRRELAAKKAGIAVEQLSDSERELNAFTQKMTTDEERFAKTTERLIALRERLSRAYGENSAEIRRFDVAYARRQKNFDTRKGDAQDVEVYGLKPWQLTNLGYQVNDVVSGLAMGQNPVQILAQQAGQFAQIWPNVMVTVARSIPQIAILGAAFAPVIAALARLKSESDTFKQFTAELTLSADGARYNAAELTKVAVAMRGLGIATKEARSMVSGFVKEGFSTEDMAEIARMAKELAAVTGESIPDAAAKLTKAFGGNVETVRDLDRELNFLTAAQYEQIRAMDASGDRAGAMALAQEILQARLAETVTPLTNFDRAVKGIKASWNSLVETVKTSGFIKWLADDISKGIGALANDIEMIAGALERIRKFAQNDYTPAEEKAQLTDRRSHLQSRLSDLKADQARDGAFQFGLYQGQIEEVEGELRQIEARLKEITAETEAAATAASKGADASGEAAAATEEQKKAALEVDAVVAAQADALRQSYESTLLTSREQFVQNALIDARNAALQKANDLGVQFLGLTEEQTAAIRSQAGALYDAQQSAALTGNLSSFVGKVVGVESGGNPNAKNPNSTATGLGQFIESTWLAMFKRHFPDRAQGMTNAAILALRKDAALSRQMVEIYAKENADVLQRAGVAVNEASLYLAHFLGPKGAVAVMAAAGTTQVSSILQPGQINANKSILQGKTAGEVRDWAAKKMAVSPAEIAVNERLVELETERAEEAREYNEGYQERVTTLQSEIGMQTMAAREAAIAKAIRDEEVEAARAGLELTKAQREEVARLTGELFDRQNVDAEVNRLMEERGVIVEKLKLAESQNDAAGMEAAKDQLETIDDTLTRAIDKAVAFWQAMGGPGADLAVEKLGLVKQQLQDQTDELTTRYLPTAEELNERLADSAVSSMDAFAQAVADGAESWETFGDAARRAFGQLILDIGEAIMKQAILNALSGGTPGGGAGGGIAASAIAGIFHEGGIVGSSAPRRMVNPAIFAGAARYHTGGMAGLKPNEVPIIAERGEEILTADDPRHRANASGATVKVVNVLDPAEILEKALGSEVGEKAFINFMARRSRQINGVLG